MSSNSKHHSQIALFVKFSLLIVTAAFLSSCVSSRTINSFGTTLLAVGPGAFNCPLNPDLELKIVQQNGTDDAISILCRNRIDDCTAPTPASGKAVVKQNQTVRWTLANGNATQFYVIFDADKSPAHGNNNRGSNVVGSEGGSLCLKVNRSAKNDPTNGFAYPYSVYVKYCAGVAGCTPKVLDPILYVR